MNILSDFIPIILFFAAYKLYGIYLATACAIFASCVQVALTYVKTKKVEKMQIITLLSIIILGGITLIAKDEIFIKLKPTIMNWVLSIVFIGSNYFGKKTVLENMLSDNLTLPKQAWQQATLHWGIFFAILGALNIYIVYHFSTDVWVNFKLFGILGLTILFTIIQSINLRKYVEK